MAQKETLTLRGEAIYDRASFYEEVTNVILNGNSDWGKNLDAFNDVLRGGFGSPPGGFNLIWQNHATSKQALGDHLFNTIVEIIQDHGPGGEEADDGVVLVLD